jgi:hypothetical protein
MMQKDVTTEKLLQESERIIRRKRFRERRTESKVFINDGGFFGLAAAARPTRRTRRTPVQHFNTFSQLITIKEHGNLQPKVACFCVLLAKICTLLIVGRDCLSFESKI